MPPAAARSLCGVAPALERAAAHASGMPGLPARGGLTFRAAVQIWEVLSA